MDTTFAKDIMSTELITLREDDNLEDALKALINHRITGLPVVNSKGEMVGVLSEYDLIRQISRHEKLNPKVFLEKIEFSKNPQSISVETPLGEIVKQFLDAKFRRVPVLDQNKKLVGIITRRDLMRLYFYRAKLSG